MRYLKLGFFIALVLLCQTVILPRLNFFGVSPDLILVSVVIYAIQAEQRPATVFSAVTGFLQDLLSAGAYLNTVLKVVASNIIAQVKDGYVGEDYSLAVSMVAVMSAVYALAETAIMVLFLRGNFSFFPLVFKIIVSAGYNTLFVPLLYPAIRELARGE